MVVLLDKVNRGSLEETLVPTTTNAVKVFFWRACVDALPTKHNFFNKKIVANSLYPFCMLEEETLGHILWSCHLAMDVWLLGGKPF